MPTYSGTYNFSLTAQQLVNAALVKTGAFDQYATIPAADYASVLQSLEIMVKEMALNGMPLWCIQDIAFQTVAGQGQYNLSTITGSTLPLRILDQYIVDNQGNSVTLEMTSRYDWDTLGQKNQQSVANQMWYDPQLNGGTVTLYNVPINSNYTVHVIVQLQMQDVGALTNNLAFPQEAYRMLLWNLVDEISLDYRMPADERLEVNQRATAFRDKFFDAEFGQEQASITFTPSQRTF